MKTTLIDYTGKGSGDPMEAARLLVYTKNTRLEQGATTRTKVSLMTPEELRKELDYIATTIRSSWEFVDYTFEVQDVTRAFTHQLVRTRHGSYAQQAQRVVDMRSFRSLVPQTVVDAGKIPVWDKCMTAIADAYQELAKAEIPTQDCRGVLPTNVLTNIIVKWNLRTFADIVGKRENLRAQGEYADVVRSMVANVLEVHPWVEPFLYPERTRTPALDALLKEALGDKSPIDAPQVNLALKELDALKGTWG